MAVMTEPQTAVPIAGIHLYCFSGLEHTARGASFERPP